MHHSNNNPSRNFGAKDKFQNKLAPVRKDIILMKLMQHSRRHRRLLNAPVAAAIDLLAILKKSLDRAIFLYNFIREVRLSGVRASIAIVHIRKFYKL